VEAQAVTGTLEVSRAAFVLVVAALGAGALGAPAPVDPPAEDADGAGRRPRPIAQSVESAVDELMKKHFSSCGRAEDDGLPCFPITIERKWQYSVAESLEHLEFDDSPAPGRPPTVGEMSSARPGPLSASGSVGSDPVCKGKQLLKAITGRSRTYYLYRVWDATGERAVLREEPLDASDWSAAPDFHFVELGSFGDECEAIAAWRKELREIRARHDRAGTAPDIDGGDERVETEELGLDGGAASWPQPR
jgi:hypothetical protein